MTNRRDRSRDPRGTQGTQRTQRTQGTQHTPRRETTAQNAANRFENAFESAFAITARSEQVNRRLRFLTACFVIIAMLIGARLILIQMVESDRLGSEARSQRTSIISEPAHRGAITDRNGRQLAYTMAARSLTVHPKQLPKFLEERHRLNPTTVLPPEERIEEIAIELPKYFAGQNVDIKPEDIRSKLTADTTYEVLVRNADPDIAEKVANDFPEITSERQDVRQYPNGSVAANIIGKISAENRGQFGFELSQDARLQGINGSRTVDIGVNGYSIPGSTRDVRPPVDGDSFELTIDINAQAYIQQLLQQAKEKSEAKSASAVVMDTATGEIIAMATSDAINPNGNIERQMQNRRRFGDRNTADVFEPGSVAKIMTAAAAIEERKTTPDEVITVPGSIKIAGVSVRDAWDHGDVRFTTTGIFGKSSNVGTLILAKRVGEQKMYDYFRKFGVGQPLNVGLPYETQGYMPEISQWSGGTFANLPIGQGMSMSVLQMTSIYQAMANNGLRVEPRLIKKITTADGTEIELPEQEKTQVVSPKTARTVIDMFRAVTQRDATGVQQGTGPAAAVAGYQVSGKTGTAQQINPETKRYSNSNYWINFAGVAPADKPRFTIGIMLDDPKKNTDGSAGHSAAPLFHDIMTWLLDHYNVAPSPNPGSKLILEAR